MLFRIVSFVKDVTHQDLNDIFLEIITGLESVRDVIKMISDHDERRGHCYKTKNYHVFISVIFQLYSVPGFNVGPTEYEVLH